MPANVSTNPKDTMSASTRRRRAPWSLEEGVGGDPPLDAEDALHRRADQAHEGPDQDRHQEQRGPVDEQHPEHRACERTARDRGDDDGSDGGEQDAGNQAPTSRIPRSHAGSLPWRGASTGLEPRGLERREEGGARSALISPRDAPTITTLGSTTTDAPECVKP